MRYDYRKTIRRFLYAIAAVLLCIIFFHMYLTYLNHDLKNRIFFMLAERHELQLLDELARVNTAISLPNVHQRSNPSYEGDYYHPKLIGLWLNENQNKLYNISPLRGLPIEELDISNTSVADLSPLRGMPLQALYIDRNPLLSDLRPLSGIMSLRKLDASHTAVKDISPIQGMMLKELKLAGNYITDLSPLAGIDLEYLDISGNKELTDLSPLKGMNSLRELNISGTMVADITPLIGLPIENLLIFDTPAAKIPLPDNLRITTISGHE